MRIGKIAFQLRCGWDAGFEMLLWGTRYELDRVAGLKLAVDCRRIAVMLVRSLILQQSWCNR